MQSSLPFVTEFSAPFRFRMRLRSLAILLVLCISGVHSAIAQTDGLPRILQLDENSVVVANARELNSEFNEGAPVMTPDNKYLLYTSKKTGKDVLYAVEMNGDQFAAITKYLELPGKEQINTVTFTTDGQMVVASCSDRKDGLFRSTDIYAATLDNGTINIHENYGRPLNDDYWDTHPALSPDGQTLLFVTDRDDRDGDIYISTRSGNGWSAPVRAAFSTDNSDLAPQFSHDGKYVYFASDGLKGMGGLDLYVVERTGENSWGTPRNMGSGINSRGNDFFFAVSPSGDQAFFASDREGGMGGTDIYRVSAKPVVEAPKMAILQLRLINAATNQPITAMPEVRLTAEGQAISDEAPGIEFAASMLAGTAYELNVGADGFVPATASGSAPMAAGPFVKEVRLTPSKARIFGQVTNVFSHNPVQATLTIENVGTGAKATVNTDAQGNYSYNANPATSYRISTQVTDYDPFATNVEVPQAREEMINVEKAIRLQPANIDAVMLYFDFNKSNLKKDEAAKITRFIHQVKENSYVRIEVNGHTDDVGSDEYNEKLSERRAITVEDYLLSQGVPRDQLAIVKGFGKAAPLVEGTSDEARAKNRRVEVRIVGMDK
jgi:outer membrane protein OmpA-like peptidoglycan-associated protein/Tol biopolymer transport system component